MSWSVSLGKEKKRGGWKNGGIELKQRLNNSLIHAHLVKRDAEDRNGRRKKTGF